MIMHQSLILPVMGSETPVGYASRMALKMRCSLRAFCSRTNIPMQGLLNGASSAIASLRHLCQLPEGTFAATTYLVMPSRRYLLAGQEFSYDQISREALRVCPVCVEQQISAGRDLHEIWSPREWQLTPLHVCDVHSVPILLIKDNDLRSGSRQDFASQLHEAVMQGHLRTGEFPHVTESGLGHHIRRRLRGLEDGHWLSRMPLYAAIKTADLIGVAARYGVQKPSQELDIAERFEAGRLGYEILGEGDVGLRNLFSRFQRVHSGEASNADLLPTFGRIHVSMLSWRDTAYDPLRDVLRQHLVETMAFGPGDVLFGKEITERRIHSGRTVAAELGLSPATARKRLRSIGVLAEATENPTWEQTFFDVRTHADGIRRLCGAMQRAEAMRYLGLQRVDGFFVDPRHDRIDERRQDQSHQSAFCEGGPRQLPLVDPGKGFDWSRRGI